VDAVLLAILLEPVDPEQIVLVRALDGDAKLFGEHAGLAAMVDMAVGEQDLLDRYAGLGGGRFEPRQVAAGIGESAAHRLGAPDQAAILLQRRDRQDRGAQRRVLGRRLAHLAGSSVAIDGGSSFIDAATASARRRTRRMLPPASLARFSSLQPRRINSAKMTG